MSKLRKLTKRLLLSSVVTLLVACGGGGSSPSSNIVSVTGISLSAPSEYYAGATATIPVVVTNTGTTLQDNLNYQISNNTTHANLSFDAQSLTNCKTIAAGSNCTLKVNVPATSMPGAFAVNISSGVASNRFKQVMHSLTGTQATEPNVTIGLTKLTVNNSTGIAGVGFYYPSGVSLPDNNTGMAVVTMVVNSSNVEIQC